MPFNPGAFNPSGTTPVNPMPSPSPGPSPTPSPSSPATTTQSNTKPYSGPTFLNPGQSQGGGTYYGGFHGLDGQQNRVQPGGRSTTQLVESGRSLLDVTNHPNDRTGSRAYAGVTGHAAPNMLTDAHATLVTPRHLA